MSDQPTFRPRVLPMPKVGDILVAPTLRGNEVCVVEHVETDLFVTSYGTFRLDWKQDWYPRWNWQDPAVEAQRLMEAAYRADTSEFPEWMTQTIEAIKTSPYPHLNADRIWRNAVGSELLSWEYPTEVAYHLLRWQAQQEQK